MIEVVKAPPFATIQDLGWDTGRAIGLPRSGAMDPASLRLANAVVGNSPGAAAIEWALGAGTLRFEEEAVAVVAGRVDIRLDDRAAAPWTPLQVHASSMLTITPQAGRRFVYVAVRGGVDVPRVLGSRSTYLPGGFGGHEGRRLKTGDRLPIGAPVLETASRVTAFPERPGEHPAEPRIRVTRGPQWNRFDPAAREAFFAGRFTVSHACDRMGYRLSGPVITPRETATLPSEAACPGAVQIPDGGQPIVLMPDGPTVGGYPKLAVVIEADLGLLAQRPPGAEVRFVEVTPAEARATRGR
jgi:biotin-dependent carboxylase-like uncharacterized protein